MMACQNRPFEFKLFYIQLDLIAEEMHVIRRGSLWRAIRNLHSSSLAKDRTDEPRIRKKEVTLSGIQPTGTPHLGNYLGALRQWTALQDSTGLDNNECIFQIADLHALTSSSSKAKSTTTAKESIAMGTALLAMGIDPSKSLLLRQSLVPQHSELAWILFCQTPIGWLKRMHQWKSKAGGAPGSDSTAAEEAVSIGLLSYPVLQAADILLYQTTQVPVGEDQAQHLNLAAMIARSFNSKVKDRVFQVPRALLGLCFLFYSTFHDASNSYTMRQYHRRERGSCHSKHPQRKCLSRIRRVGLGFS